MGMHTGIYASMEQAIDHTLYNRHWRAYVLNLSGSFQQSIVEIPV
jgi:hypothetical protein